MTFGRELPHSFQEALRVARQILSSNLELVKRDVVQTEAEQLVIAAYRQTSQKLTENLMNRMELYTRAGDRLPEAAAERLLVLAGGRAEGKLLQHLTGYQAFLEHEYQVGPEVLVPRPETELLVSLALQELRLLPKLPVLGLEIGVGSGAISIEILSALPGLSMLASELSAAAETCALANARKILGPAVVEAGGRFRVLRAPAVKAVWEPFTSVLGEGRAGFLISNPPYLSTVDEVDADVLANEPAAALFAPEGDPLYFYREIADRAQQFLKEDAPIFLELAPERSQEILQLFQARGWSASLIHDLTQRDRFLISKGRMRNG